MGTITREEKREFVLEKLAWLSGEANQLSLDSAIGFTEKNQYFVYWDSIEVRLMGNEIEDEVFITLKEGTSKTTLYFDTWGDVWVTYWKDGKIPKEVGYSKGEIDFSDLPTQHISQEIVRGDIVKYTIDYNKWANVTNKSLETNTYGYFYNLEQTKKTWPYHLQLEGGWESFDDLEYSIVQFAGLPHGVCYNEMTTYGKLFCPLLKHLDVYDDKLEIADNHCHIGNWKMEPVKKTGYDYGIVDYFFKKEVDYTRCCDLLGLI